MCGRVFETLFNPRLREGKGAGSADNARSLFTRNAGCDLFPENRR